MEIIDHILSRRSPARLAEPAPTAQQVDMALQAAANAPDHGKLQPWRFIVIGTASRQRFGAALAQCLQRAQPDAKEDALERERQKALRAPLIIAFATKVVADRKGVPMVEQVTSTAAAVQNAWLAFASMGYGCMWKTGEAAYDDGMKAALGLETGDQIVAFLYVGTPLMPGAPAAPRKADLVVHW